MKIRWNPWYPRSIEAYLSSNLVDSDTSRTIWRTGDITLVAMTYKTHVLELTSD